MKALMSPKSKRMLTSAVKAAISIILHHQQTFMTNETESESNEGGDSDRNSHQDGAQNERQEAHRDTPESTSLEGVAELFNPTIETHGPGSKPGTLQCDSLEANSPNLTPTSTPSRKDSSKESLAETTNSSRTHKSNESTMAQGHPSTPLDQNSDSSMSEELLDALPAPTEFHHPGPKLDISSSSEGENHCIYLYTKLSKKN